MKRLALATAVLAILLFASGCTASEPVSESPMSTAIPEPTHAVVLVTDSWTEPSPPESGGTIPTVHGLSWRVSAIELSTGEERILAEETSQTTFPLQVPVISPDGTELLYATMELPAEALPLSRGGWWESMRLHRLDLDTGESSEVCSATVRSFGWDGADIIVTLWRDMWHFDTGPDAGGFTSPPPNAVLRVSGSAITTIVPEVPTPSDVDREGGMRGQLEYLGSDREDLYFHEIPDAFGYSLGPQPTRVWRIRSGETSPTIALQLDQGMAWAEPGGPHESLPGGDGMYGPPMEQHLSEELFPTRQWYFTTVEHPGGWFDTAETSAAILVRRAENMRVERSFETTNAEPLPGHRVQPVFDAGVTRWLDQRRLGPPTVPEEGLWLCETDAASLETTSIALLARSKTLGTALGYIGSDLDVLFATGNNNFMPPAPRAIFLWDRSSGDRRTLIELEGSHDTSLMTITYVGGVALE